MTQDVFGIVGTTQGGSFRVERAVAEGGFSVIYRAQHGAFRAPVALKCLKVPGDLTSSERASYLEKFREEAEILFRLSATITEVVRPLHVDQLSLDDGRFAPFLALEWLEGEALDEIIDHRRRNGQAPMGLFKLAKLLTPVARGLARGHRFPGPAGTISIVHRDIKPQNIFVATVAGAEKVKILDFGIATAIMAAERGAGLHTLAETDPVRAFTPRYAAPEQWEPERFGAVGAWTDVWGLAITMVEALLGQPALQGTQDEMRRTVFDTHARPTPRTLGATISDEAEAAFTRALAVEPKRRTRTVEGFWTELEAALRLPRSLSRRDDRRDTGRVSLSRPTLTGRPLPREDYEESIASSRRSELVEPSARISEVGPEPRSSGAAPPAPSDRREPSRREDDGGRLALAATLMDPRRRSAPPPATDDPEVLAAAQAGLELELDTASSAPEPMVPSSDGGDGVSAAPACVAGAASEASEAARAPDAMHALEASAPAKSPASADPLGLDLPPMPVELDSVPLELERTPLVESPPLAAASPILGSPPELDLPGTERELAAAVEPAAPVGPSADAPPAAEPLETSPAQDALAASRVASLDANILPLELDLATSPTPDQKAAQPPIEVPLPAPPALAAPAAQVSSTAERRVPIVPSKPRQSLMSVLRLPAQLIGAGLLLVIVDLVVGLRIAELRPIMYLGALLVVAGTAVFFWRFLSEQ